MKKIKLAVVGGAGRMGQQIIKEIQKYKSINLIAAIEKKNSPSINSSILCKVRFILWSVTLP